MLESLSHPNGSQKRRWRPSGRSTAVTIISSSRYFFYPTRADFPLHYVLESLNLDNFPKSIAICGNLPFPTFFTPHRGIISSSCVVLCFVTCFGMVTKAVSATVVVRLATRSTLVSSDINLAFPLRLRFLPSAIVPSFLFLCNRRPSEDQ